MSADTPAQSSSASKPCQRASVSVSVSVSVAESLSIHHTGASSHRRIVASSHRRIVSGTQRIRRWRVQDPMHPHPHVPRLLRLSLAIHTPGLRINAFGTQHQSSTNRQLHRPVSSGRYPHPHLRPLSFPGPMNENELAHLSPKSNER